MKQCARVMATVTRITTPESAAFAIRDLFGELDVPSESVVTTYDQLVALQMPIGKPRS